MRPSPSLLCAAAALLPTVAPAASPVVNVYGWADYLADTTLPAFQKESGVKVRYDTFDSNEVLQAKLLTGRSGYDVVMPSNVFLARQIPAGLYQPIDKRRLPHYKGLDPAILKLMETSDPGNRYAVPFFWGINTLGVNVGKVERALGGPLPQRQWDLLFKPAYVARLKSCGVSLLDSPAEVFPIALKYLGRDPASRDEADYRAALALLKTIRPYITRFSSSGYMNEMAAGSLCLVYGYGGDINIAKRRAEAAGNGVKIRALVPREGVAIWIDSLAIPRDSANVENAYKFIDYTLRPRVAAANANVVNYAPGSLAARAHIGREQLDNPSIFPGKAEIANSFVQAPLDARTQRLIGRLWVEFKTRKP